MNLIWCFKLYQLKTTPRNAKRETRGKQLTVDHWQSNAKQNFFYGFWSKRLNVLRPRKKFLNNVLQIPKTSSKFEIMKNLSSPQSWNPQMKIQNCMLYPPPRDGFRLSWKSVTNVCVQEDVLGSGYTHTTKVKVEFHQEKALNCRSQYKTSSNLKIHETSSTWSRLINHKKKICLVLSQVRSRSETDDESNFDRNFWTSKN